MNEYEYPLGNPEIRMMATNPQDVDPVAERAWVEETHDDMRLRIENGSFHSEVDRKIAAGFADALYGTYHNGLSTYQTYDTAMGSLWSLIPITEGDGKRYIAGKALSNVTEKWIASRLESPEVDLVGPEGAWGRLPSAVKEKILETTPDLCMEMTGNCTVACKFCSFADKGEISSKASFESIEALIQEFVGHQPSNSVVADFLYHGTDPFDAKWKTPSGGELDYLSIARSHAKITARRRALGTSTAVPIGEEFRVLYFANQFLTDPDFTHGGSLRLSRSNANADRVDHIVNVTNGITPTKGIERFVISDVANNVALRGSAWKRKLGRKINHWDIMGPNCFDGVVLGPRDARVNIMQGASPEQPNGEIRFPLDDDLGDGTHLYVVPVLYNIPDYKHAVYNPAEIYPDTKVLVYTFDNGVQREAAKYGTVERYPHRALLRLMGAMTLYDYGTRKNGLSREAAQADFERNFSRDLEIVQAHLVSSQNPSMSRALEILTELGYIS